jgi:hypothetical protein
MLPVFIQDKHGVAIVPFSWKPEKMAVNHELTITFFLVNNFRACGGFLFLSSPSLHASVQLTHFGKISFVMARVLWSLIWIFSWRRA